MERYHILRQGVFESKSKFEERLNSAAAEGWKAISIAEHTRTVILLERK